MHALTWLLASRPFHAVLINCPLQVLGLRHMSILPKRPWILTVIAPIGPIHGSCRVPGRAPPSPSVPGHRTQNGYARLGRLLIGQVPATQQDGKGSPGVKGLFVRDAVHRPTVQVLDTS
ncbi:hypothetical protein B0H63DRAFT_152583 [Podospora didyma]|uniref:Secreted protein n=1 Tax=Podospora didyma TaxID=330526 RepID=A0AAE0NT12_9PEZI|nr:hypothetical protein B0H63DRAFT_152583 [Podospora didyma]